MYSDNISKPVCELSADWGTVVTLVEKRHLFLSLTMPTMGEDTTEPAFLVC